MAKYRNKYRIESARAQWWDYGWNGAYFVTVCTTNRKHFLGEIKNGEMILSNTGVIANVLWWQIPNHASFIELGEFQVMPNHIHGIIIIDRPDYTDEKRYFDEARHFDEIRHALRLDTPRKNRFRNQGKNTVSSIVGGYKSAVTNQHKSIEISKWLAISFS